MGTPFQPGRDDEVDAADDADLPSRPAQDPTIAPQPGWDDGGPPGDEGSRRFEPPRPPAAPPSKLELTTVLGLLFGAFALLGLAAGAFIVLVPLLTGPWGRGDSVPNADLAKIVIALSAAWWGLLVAFAAAIRRPAPPVLQKIVGIGLGLAAIVAYFNAFQFGYPKYYHRWEHYHTYVGARYLPELGYDGLYRCGVIAEDELGEVDITDAKGRTSRVDLSREVREAGKTIRSLGPEDGMIPASEVLAHPELCKDRFSPARWDRFKEDVRFFRIESDKGYWTDMQRDHGYSMSPVWTIGGRFFAELHPASVGYQQLLSMLDLVYLSGMLAALWWAFGWRVSVAAAVFWGCQAAAPFYWTGGAFLKQDWLFYLVLAACLLRKRHYKLAGAAMAYASLLRMFPGWALLGWIVVGAAHFIRHRTIAQSHRRVLLGAALGLAALLPLSVAVAGTGAWGQFLERARTVEQSPLTNHMGLQVVIAQDLGDGPGSGRMEFAKDSSLLDPFAVWKQMRRDRYERLAPVGYAVILATFVAFVLAMRRRRLPWIAGCLGAIFIVLLAQITCFYYTFLVLVAPLTRVKRWLEVYLFGFAALTQILWTHYRWNDDKYTALSAASLLFGLGLIAAFWPAPRREIGKRRKRKTRGKKATAA